MIALFDYPADIRRGIYTTNAIESLYSAIRKPTRKRKLCPHDESALKAVHLAIQAMSQRCTKPIMNWKAALNRFTIEFEDRVMRYL
ncbi:MAG: transposase [Gammaproteobacteria bacterium]|nr:transposase [Gammaproteobacteria bacterium]